MHGGVIVDSVIRELRNIRRDLRTLLRDSIYLPVIFPNFNILIYQKKYENDDIRRPSAEY